MSNRACRISNAQSNNAAQPDSASRSDRDVGIYIHCYPYANDFSG